MTCAADLFDLDRQIATLAAQRRTLATTLYAERARSTGCGYDGSEDREAYAIYTNLLGPAGGELAASLLRYPRALP